MSEHHANIHIEPHYDNPPSYHCPLDDGRMSIRVSGSYGSVNVYVCGTRHQLAEWARAVLREAIAGDEGPSDTPQPSLRGGGL